MGRLLQIVEESLNVLHLAEIELKFAEPEWPADRALAWLKVNGFDAASLNEPEPRRIIIAATLQSGDRPVAEQADVLDATLLVSADLSLGQGIRSPAAKPFYLSSRETGSVASSLELTCSDPPAQ